MAGLMEKLKKNSQIKDIATLDESIYFVEKDMIMTDVPMVNVGLSGKLDGGLTPGLTVLAGPSKHFKTSFALLMAAAYQKKYKEAVILFYDSEFGSPRSYFEAYGIDTSRVLHVPIMDIEELKFDIMSQLSAITRKDNVIIVVDSIGNLASKKEVEDAKDQKSVADMTRAKSLKGLFRMITPYLTKFDIPMLAVNHTYQTMEMFSKAVVSGGTGITYSADNIWIIGRRQTKNGTEVVGYDFIINVEKSRFVKEKSKIPISVSWEGGIEKYSGIFDLGISFNYIIKTGSRYQLMDLVSGEIEEAKLWRKGIPDTFFESLVNHEPFKEQVMKQYMIGYKTELAEDFLNSIPSTADDEYEEEEANKEDE